MKKIFITGISGTGKTTVYDELKKRGFAVIGLDEVDDLCCWVNKETGKKLTERTEELNTDFTSKHRWVCDTDYLARLLTEENEKKTELVFVLGVASNQIAFLDMFDKVLLLQCKPETFLHRLTHRTNNEFGKDKTIQDAVLGWYEEFEKNMLDRGAISINTEKPINDVVKEVLKHLI